MPNHCTNNIIITGPESDVEKFWNGIKKFQGYDESENGELDIFQSYTPMPVELRGTESPKDSPNWYDWACENWGTKWGMYDTDFDFRNGLVIGRYDSAWGPCDAGILNVSKLFPTLTFKVDYCEPGMAFMGRQVCQNGEETESWSREMTDEDFEELGYNDED